MFQSTEGDKVAEEELTKIGEEGDYKTRRER